MTDQLRAALRAKQAAAYLGICESSLWDRAKNDPTFPKPRKLGPRTTVWMREELDAFLASCVSKKAA